MENRAKDLAALIALVCLAITAAAADERNAGDIRTYILAGVCLLVAMIVTELSWHGCLDRWDRPPDRAGRRRNREHTQRKERAHGVG